MLKISLIDDKQLNLKKFDPFIIDVFVKLIGNKYMKKKNDNNIRLEICTFKFVKVSGIIAMLLP